MGNDGTDLDRMAAEMGDILAVLTGNTHAPSLTDGSDSVTITKNGWIASVVKLQRLRDWAEGLAASHRSYRNEA